MRTRPSTALTTAVVQDMSAEPVPLPLALSRPDPVKCLPDVTMLQLEPGAEYVLLLASDGALEVSGTEGQAAPTGSGRLGSQLSAAAVVLPFSETSAPACLPCSCACRARRTVSRPVLRR